MDRDIVVIQLLLATQWLVGWLFGSSATPYSAISMPHYTSSSSSSSSSFSSSSLAAVAAQKTHTFCQLNLFVSQQWVTQCNSGINPLVQTYEYVYYGSYSTTVGSIASSRRRCRRIFKILIQVY